MDNFTSGSKPILIQVAPGVWVDPTRHQFHAQRKYILLDGLGYRQLGLADSACSPWPIMRRLWIAGKIKIHQISPRCALLDLESWNRHLEACSDPDFWDKASENLNEYRGAY